MGDLLVLAGERFNVLQTGTLSVTSEDPLFPKERLYEARPIQPYKSTGVTSQNIDVDGNRIVNGAFTEWSAGAPTGWTVSGTVAETTVAGEVRSGSAVRVNGGSANILQRITVRAGEVVNLNGWRRILAAGQGHVQGFLQNLTTGKYWDGSSWGASATPFLNDNSNTSYTQFGPTTLTVEPYSTVLADTCELALTIGNIDGTATDYVFLDDWFLWPSINFCSVHGHNIGAAVTVALQRGSTSPAGTVEANLTIAQPAFYHALATVRSDRYWRLAFGGTNAAPYIIGDIILGYALALSRKMSQAPGYEIREVYDTIAAVTETGDHQAVARSEQPRQIIGMEFSFSGTTADDDMEENRDEVFRRSLGEVRPLVIVPDTARPDVVLGKIDRSFSVRRMLSDYYTDRSLIVSGLPFPLATS